MHVKSLCASGSGALASSFALVPEATLRSSLLPSAFSLSLFCRGAVVTKWYTPPPQQLVSSVPLAVFSTPVAPLRILLAVLWRRGCNHMVHTAAETTCLQLFLAFVSRQHVSLCRAMSAMSGDVVDRGVSEKHTRGYFQCSISWPRPLHMPHCTSVTDTQMENTFQSQGICW